MYVFLQGGNAGSSLRAQIKIAEKMDVEPEQRPAGEENGEDEDEATGPPPNNTLRVNNLNEKVKGKVLNKSLRAVFKQFGDILDVVAMDSVRCLRSRPGLRRRTTPHPVCPQATRAGLYSI